MRLLISGSKGLVGNALTDSLKKDGHEIVSLVRRAPASTSEVEWHPNKGLLDTEHIGNVDVVVHLAGESIASGRWTDEKKRLILESRVKGTTLLSETIARLPKPPSTFICASAIGFYGDRGEQLLTEASPAGTGFLADVCTAWEKATETARAKGIRTVLARFGVILDDSGGALGKMLTPFRMGVGGKVGDGQQWMSWIAIEDVIAALRFVIEKPSVQGPVNFVAPNPVRNSEFTKVLGQALSRPTIFPMPAFAARLAFGEMADALLLASSRVEPKRLIDEGYQFRFSTLAPALDHILQPT